MASKIKVDQLETADGTGSITLNNDIAMASGKTLPAASLTGSLPSGMGGKILQVKYAHWHPTSHHTVTNQGYLSNLEITLTPVSSSSRFIHMLTLGTVRQAGSDNYMEVRYYKDSSSIDGGGHGLGYTNYYGTYMVYDYKPHSYVFNSAAGDANARTYKIRTNTDHNFVIHQNSDNTHIVMEYEV